MTLTRTYQNELKSSLANFQSTAGLPKKAVTLTLPELKLIVQYETIGELPKVEKLRKAGKELAVASGTGAVIAGGVAMLIGRTLLGGALARIGIAGAFGAVGLGLLGPGSVGRRDRRRGWLHTLPSRQEQSPKRSSSNFWPRIARASPELPAGHRRRPSHC